MRRQQRPAAAGRPVKKNTTAAPEERASRTQPGGRGRLRQRPGLRRLRAEENHVMSITSFEEKSIQNLTLPFHQKLQRQRKRPLLPQRQGSGDHGQEAKNIPNAVPWEGFQRRKPFKTTVRRFSRDG